MNKNILHLVVPNIILNISVPLLGMVDMFIVGYLDTEDYIGAIALAVMLFNFIYWSFSFLEWEQVVLQFRNIEHQIIMDRQIFFTIIYSSSYNRNTYYNFIIFYWSYRVLFF